MMTGLGDLQQRVRFRGRPGMGEKLWEAKAVKETSPICLSEEAVCADEETLEHGWGGSDRLSTNQSIPNPRMGSAGWEVSQPRTTRKTRKRTSGGDEVNEPLNYACQSRFTDLHP